MVRSKPRFAKEWFNPLYFILNEIIKDTGIRTVLVYGGKSSAKTVSVCQLLAKEAFVKGANTIAFRKESAIIPTTLKKSFELAIESMYLTNAFETFDRRFECQDNTGGTSEIIMKGLDKEEKAKGIESYKYLYLDELNHFTKEEYTQFNLSLRGIPGQKLFASWNPVDENSWVKTDLVDQYTWVDTDWRLPCPSSFVKRSTCGKVVLIKTTYEDNYWIVGSPGYAVNEKGELVSGYGYRDENLIAEYEGLRLTNNNAYKVNVLGEWGKTVFGGEFLKCWRSEKHTGIYKYNPELALHLIFDENVNPYFPCGIFQVGDDQKSIYLIDIIALENPENTTEKMCAEIIRRLIGWGHKGEVYIGGDPASKKEDVKLEKGYDLFRLIIEGLKAYRPYRRVLPVSPAVIMSKNFFNAILESELYGLRFMVDKNCRKAILDYENTKEDKNGKVDKKPVTHPVTKVSYQPWGHFVDLTRYFLCYTFANEYALYQKGGVSTLPMAGKNSSKNSY